MMPEGSWRIDDRVIEQFCFCLRKEVFFWL